MPKFKIKESAKKTVKVVTFDKESDYTAVTLLVKGEPAGKTCLLHNVQAEKLIAQKKAVKADKVVVEEATPVVITKKVDKDKK